MTQDTAQVYGFVDRGVIATGYKADINIIDYEKCSPSRPRNGLRPSIGRRSSRPKADGYTATICDGVVTYENGVHTGQMPGRLVRGGQIEKV